MKEKNINIKYTKKELLKDVNIDELIPYDNNPRNNDSAINQVANSIAKNGYIKTSIVVDENNILLCGHTTLKAMVKLDYKQIPQVDKIYGLTELQKKDYRIRDNKTGEFAEWDTDRLKQEFDEIKELLPEGDLDDICGFDKFEVEEIYFEVNENESDTKDKVTDNVDKELPEVENLKCPKCGHLFIID